MEKSYEEILRLLGFFGDADPGNVFRGSSQFMTGKGRPVEGQRALAAGLVKEQAT